MPLSTNREVFITCAVTGSGSPQERTHGCTMGARIISPADVREKLGLVKRALT